MVSDLAKHSLMVSACNALPDKYWELCITPDQKSHFCNVKQSYIFLAISLDIDGDRRLKNLLKKKAYKTFKSYRDYILALYSLIESIWQYLPDAEEKPASVGYRLTPLGFDLEEIIFPFNSPEEATGHVITAHAYLYFKLCLEDRTISASELRKMHRLDRDLRIGHRLEELKVYQAWLDANRRGFEEHYSLVEFCERVAEKVSGNGADINGIYQKYLNQKNELDEIMISGKRNAKGIGFIGGRRVEPTKGGNWWPAS
jgi:hypothetical protein